MKRTSKLIAIALVLVLAIGMLPMSALAAPVNASNLTGTTIKGSDLDAPDMPDKALENMTAYTGYDTQSPGRPAGQAVTTNTEEYFPLYSLALPYEAMKDPMENIVTFPSGFSANSQMKKISQAELDSFYGNVFGQSATPITFQNTFKSYGTLVSGRVSVEVGDLYAIYMANGATSTTPTDVRMIFIEIVQSNQSGNGGGIGGGGEIGGGSTVQKGGINVVLPLNLNFVLDPLMLKSDVPGNQFAGADFQIMNKSEIPVTVRFDILAVPATTASLVPTMKESGYLLKLDPNDDPTVNPALYKKLIKPLTRTEADGTAKMFSMGIISAYMATAQPNYTTNLGGAYKYRIEETSAYIPMLSHDYTGPAPATTATQSSVTFLLAKPASTGVYAENFASIAAFKFYGQLASRAPWVGGDIKVAGAYTISGFTSEGYAEKYGSQMYGLNGYNGAPDFRNFPANARVEENKVTRLLVSRAEATANGGVTIALRTDNAADPYPVTSPLTPPSNTPISSVGSVVNKTTSYTFTSPADFSYVNMNGLLTLKVYPTANNVYNEILITFGTGASATTYTVWLALY